MRPAVLLGSSMRRHATLIVLALTACRSLPSPVCGDPVAWSPGTPAFREATEEWGLTGVEGTRLLAVDFDGDGWTDLVVHRGGDGADEWDGTRQSWLLRNTGQGTFEDVTRSSGFRANREGGDATGRPGSVVAFGDVDNDGDLDAYTGLSDPDGTRAETSEILINQGDGTFVLGPATNGVRVAQGDVPAGATFVDFDRDGILDLWITQNSVAGTPQQDHLYKGDGTGAFTRVTKDVGLKTKDWVDLDDLDAGLAHSNAWSANACDLNGDGWPELLASSYGRAPNHLWQNDGGTFTNRSVASGYAYDDQQDWTDNQFARCHCQANPNAEGCAGVPAPAIACDTINWRHEVDRRPYRLGGNSGATLCADVDNDGHLDLFTTEIKHWWAGENSDESELLLNTGEHDVRFERPGRDVTGIAREHDGPNWDQGDMSASFIDFDNDGWLDIWIGASDYPGNRGLLYRQVEPARFERVRVKDGIDHLRSHGSAVADFDRDGDLDLVVGHSRSRCGGSYANDCYETSQIRFFENQLGGNFVQLKLVGGEGSNRAAIGARVQVTADGVTQTREVGGGHGHFGAQDDLVLHFGLDAACEAEVTVRWPDAEGTTQTFRVTAGHRFEVHQGEKPVVME